MSNSADDLDQNLENATARVKGNAVVELVDEPGYAFGSADNARRYPTEVRLDEGFVPSSIHGVVVDGRPIVVVGASGGGTGVHEHSLIRLGNAVYFAVGPNVCRLTLGHAEVDWVLEVDIATCFGIYYSDRHDALISHGELEIVRFDTGGKILWQASGADIFTEGFSLLDDYVETIDFDRHIYRFDYETGLLCPST